MSVQKRTQAPVLHEQWQLLIQHMRKSEVKDTGIPGIKQRLKDGKYLVTLDLGRQLRMNKKTGKMEMRQVKTTYTYTTLKEAKAALGRNANICHGWPSGSCGTPPRLTADILLKNVAVPRRSPHIGMTTVTGMRSLRLSIRRLL